MTSSQLFCRSLGSPRCWQLAPPAGSRTGCTALLLFRTNLAFVSDLDARLGLVVRDLGTHCFCDEIGVAARRGRELLDRQPVFTMHPFDGSLERLQGCWLESFLSAFAARSLCDPQLIR